MVKHLLFYNRTIRILLTIMAFVVLSCVFVPFFDFLSASKVTPVIRQIPVTLISVVICLIASQIFLKYLHYSILFLEIVFFFTTLFVILYHVLKEPETILI